MNDQLPNCPVCGYHCLGKGGVGCIDKPSFLPDYGQPVSGNNDELREALRLTAIALGDGWEAKHYDQPGWHLKHQNQCAKFPHKYDNDSRWLECELKIDLIQYQKNVRAYSAAHQWRAVEVQVSDNDRLAATRWAVLKCAAVIGREKEGKG